MEFLSRELVRQCLLRVPYKEHAILKVVCKTWNAIVSNPTFYADRKISRTSQQLIACLTVTDWRAVHDDPSYNPVFAVMVYDPLNGTSLRLPPIDDPQCAGIPAWCHCAAINGKLLIIGGLDLLNKSQMKTVYIYDFATAKWSRGADMPTGRSFFACSVDPSTGLLYVAGGLAEYRNPPAGAEVYNLAEDRWEILPPMIQERGIAFDGFHSVFMGGKFMVFGGSAFDRSAEVFDVSVGTWSRWENMWRFGGNLWTSGAVAAFSGDLYVFFERSAEKYDRENNVWNVVAPLPRYIPFLMCATQWRDWIFVCGSDVTSDQISYMFNPSTGQFKGFNGHRGGQCISATTVEI